MKRARFDLGRQMAFLERQQAAGVKDEFVLATPPSETALAGASGNLRPPKPENSARPASCSASHFGVRTQRLR
jgi:hypothetical protein